MSLIELLSPIANKGWVDLYRKYVISANPMGLQNLSPLVCDIKGDAYSYMVNRIYGWDDRPYPEWMWGRKQHVQARSYAIRLQAVVQYSGLNVMKSRSSPPFRFSQALHYNYALTLRVDGVRTFSVIDKL